MTDDQRVYLVKEPLTVERMDAAAPLSERELQDLVSASPEIVGDGDPLLLIRDEQPIGDADQSGRWSLDLLFVNRAAVPILVEIKRATNPQLRREVIGQMLDYAANGVAYWPTSKIASAFADTCRSRGTDPDEVLSSFLGDEVDAASFWSGVDTNFKDGRVELLFVADRIPRELARVVEFLNEHMDTLSVRAVEVKYFRGAGSDRILVPRVIGDTQRAQMGKNTTPIRDPSITPEEFIQRYITSLDQKVAAGFQAACRILGDLGAEMKVAQPAQKSIGACVQRPNGKSMSVINLTDRGTAWISFSAAAILGDNGRQKFFDRFFHCLGQPPNATTNVKGFPSFLLTSLNDPAKAEEFRQTARDWLDVFRS